MLFSLFRTGKDPNVRSASFGKLFEIMALSSSTAVTVGFKFGAKEVSDGFCLNPNLLGLFLLKKLALLAFLVVSKLLLVVLKMFGLSVVIPFTVSFSSTTWTKSSFSASVTPVYPSVTTVVTLSTRLPSSRTMDSVAASTSFPCACTGVVTTVFSVVVFGFLILMRLAFGFRADSAFFLI